MRRIAICLYDALKRGLTLTQEQEMLVEEAFTIGDDPPMNEDKGRSGTSLNDWLLDVVENQSERFLDLVGGIHCHFCGKSVPDTGVACELDWTAPFYYQDDQEVGPACPACAGKYLGSNDDDGEVEIRPEYVTQFLTLAMSPKAEATLAKAIDET